MQDRLAVEVLDADRGTSSQTQLGDAFVAVLRGQMEQRISDLVLEIDGQRPIWLVHGILDLPVFAMPRPALHLGEIRRQLRLLRGLGLGQGAKSRVSGEAWCPGW